MTWPPTPVVPPPACAEIAVHVTVGRTEIEAAVSGDLDVSTVSRLERLLTKLESMSAPLLLDLAGVRFADSWGISPIVDAAARRSDGTLPSLNIVAASPHVIRICRLLNAPVRLPGSR